jgi:hypothetical protein
MMLRFLISILLLNQLLAADWDPLKTSKANKAKEQASQAFASGKYDLAISKYKYLLDTLKIKDDKVQLNLAHAYMRKSDSANAYNSYAVLTKAPDPKIRSVAFQQLGILESEKNNREAALGHFKNALKCDEKNSQARFNYELLLKRKDKQMPKSQDKQKRDEQKKKDQEQKKNEQNKGGDKGDKKEDKGKDGTKENKEGNKEENKDKENQGNKGNKEEKKDQKGEQSKDQEQSKKPGEDKKEGGEKGKTEKPSENGNKKGEAEKPAEKGEQKKKTQSESVAANKEQLQKMNMTEQQAKAILNAMRQGETQYIQQMKRTTGKSSRTNKKDW